MHACPFLQPECIAGQRDEPKRGAGKRAKADAAAAADACGVCGEVYGPSDEVEAIRWIACDSCNRWFHGACAGMSDVSAKAVAFDVQVQSVAASLCIAGYKAQVLACVGTHAVGPKWHSVEMTSRLQGVAQGLDMLLTYLAVCQSSSSSLCCKPWSELCTCQLVN